MGDVTSGADLFVVCKQCGSEVSPYITECPYCGNRLRRRAPKLPRAHIPGRAPRTARRGGLRALLGRTAASRAPRLRVSRAGTARWAPTPAYATVALVALACGAWVAARARGSLYAEMAVLGPLRGHWWKLFTSAFAYQNGVYTFVALFAVALFGWLLEHRHGPGVVLALFLGAGATGALVTSAVYSEPVAAGGNGAALALIAAWAAPDLHSARQRAYYEGDLLGAGALALLLLAMPFALANVAILTASGHLLRVSEASWLAGVTGGTLGLLVGMGLHRLQQAEL
jgi:membrane associated rhomboid family serine protease